MKITILGSGNLAHYFVAKLPERRHQIHQIFTPSSGHGAVLGQQAGAPVIHDLKQLSPEADVYILAVKDDAIEPLAGQLPGKEKLTIHCAGSVSLNALKKAPNRAVIWPVYSLNKQNLPLQREVPVVIDGNNPYSLEQARKIATALSSKITQADDEQRKKLHLAAVMANNFINHLLTISKSIMTSGHIPFEVLKPIIEQTFENAFQFAPERSQTGPAIRHDRRTIDRHLMLLESQPDVQHIYEALTTAIQHFYHASPNPRLPYE